MVQHHSSESHRTINCALRHPFVTDTEAAFVHQLRLSLALIIVSPQLSPCLRAIKPSTDNISAVFNAALAAN
jgi:hypothetical protein